MWGPPPQGLSPQQMMQMMQMMQAQQAATIPAGQPPVMPPGAPARAAPAVTSIVLVTSSKDGELVRSAGQRTSVPIKVELNDAQEPTGAYSTAESVRRKVASSFPDAGGDVAWKLFIGEMKDDQPFDVTLVAGDSVASADSSWRELFSCKVISDQKPVVFAQPCLVGHESRDVDRKRAASIMLQTDQTEAAAAVGVISAARPAKQGKGSDGASMRSSKGCTLLGEDSKVMRLQEKVQALVDKAQAPAYMDPRTGNSILILTNGKWVSANRNADSTKVITAGFYPEISVESIDNTFLEADGTLKKGLLFFSCISAACVCKAATGAFVSKPRGRAAAAGKKMAPPSSWYKSEVTMEGAGGHHTPKTKDGGVVLKSLWAMVKTHMLNEHGGGFDTVAENKATTTARLFTIGTGLLQTPGAQASLKAAALATQSK